MRKQTLLTPLLVLMLGLAGSLAWTQDEAASSQSASLSAPAPSALEPLAGTTVPRLVKFSGLLTDATGKPAVGTVTATFSLYELQEGGSPLWAETQNVRVDEQGHYTVLLGATQNEGLPLDLFTSGKARWLGVQPQLAGTGEQARVLLVGMPYALKAADADTLGGKPASAYVLSQDQAGPSSEWAAGGKAAATTSGRSPQTQKTGADSAKQNNGPSAAVGGSGLTNFIPIWTSSATLGTSILYQTGGNVGLNTKTPGARLDSYSPGIAVRGTSSGGSGVSGNATAASGYTSGVYGQAASTNGTGVFGTSVNWVGVGGMATAASGSPAYGVWGDSVSTSGVGVAGYEDATSGSTNGVYGQSASTSGTGVLGNASASSGYTNGVYGSVASPNGTGISGVNNASTGGNGVSGVANATSGSPSGVLGLINATSGAGVEGIATGTSGYNNGVYGQTASTQGYGVNGNAIATSGNAVGVFGEASGADGAIGVWGAYEATSGGGVGVRGDIEAAANGSAGAFYNFSGQGLILQGLSGSNAVQVFSVDPSGNLDISGNLTVAGSKSARVKLEDGREVALYAVESPENWFEDFGTAQLQGGAAEVALEPGFLQTVDTAADYHVFLTPKGDCHGLYVARTTRAGFEVRELGGGSASVAFDYRIVARRRGFENVRLQQVHVPQVSPDMKTRLANQRPPQPVKVPVLPPPRVAPKIAIPSVPQPDKYAH